MGKGEPEDDEPEFVSANDLTREFCDNTTAHGLNRIVGAENWWGKLTWSILFSVFTLTFLYQAGTLLIEYYQWPVHRGSNIIRTAHKCFARVCVCALLVSLFLPFKLEWLREGTIT